MKKLGLIMILLSVGSLTIVIADVWVNGYVKSDGTYVRGHYKSNPNHTKIDNWSTKGNINPYTGKIGTKTYNNYNNFGYRRKKRKSNSLYGW